MFWLVVWNMFYDSPYIGNFIIPTDELIFFKGVGIPPTSDSFWGSISYLVPTSNVLTFRSLFENMLRTDPIGLSLCPPLNCNLRGALYPCIPHFQTHLFFKYIHITVW